jgi:hypothetical protein
MSDRDTRWVLFWLLMVGAASSLLVWSVLGLYRPEEIRRSYEELNESEWRTSRY